MHSSKRRTALAHALAYPQFNAAIIRSRRPVRSMDKKMTDASKQMRWAAGVIGKTIAFSLSLFAGWMTWPSQNLVAPESTGEIGFMGELVVAKYAVYFFRCFIAIGLVGIVFAAFMFLARLATEPDSPEPITTEPEDNIIPRNPFD